MSEENEDRRRIKKSNRGEEKRREKERLASLMIKREDMTTNGAAERFIDEYFTDFRYVIEWKKWIFWDGKRWSKKRGESELGNRACLFAKREWKRLADETVEQDLLGEFIRYAKQVNDGGQIAKLMRLAAYDSRVTISQDELDQGEYLLNCNNETLDLETGKTHPHQQEDLITQILPVRYNPKAICPNWIEFINTIFGGSEDLIRYVQVITGYTLAGTIDEAIVPICIGGGRNGKSTFWNTLAAILGDYAGTVSQDLLLPTKNQHPTEIADLKGKRFVAVEEPEAGRKIHESKIKSMTGDTVLKARRMGEDFWEFKPSHTFWIPTNHLPQITGTDEGIWRRIKTIPFSIDLNDVVKVDPQFREKLEEEYEGILAWAVEGWKDYQRISADPDNSLMGIEPEEVVEATAQYRNDEDGFEQFIEQGVIVAEGRVIEFGDAYKRYCEFERRLAVQLTRKKFGMEMDKRFTKKKWKKMPFRDKTVYYGVGDCLDALGYPIRD
ncbi:MAG: hypothetical protein GY818_05030 [Planctomycetaceae bacterium]|nr:hypothetical protein [Planctomycetaceae bacterium]